MSSLLRQVFLPSVEEMRPDEERPWTLMQDNAPIHTARAVKQWFEDHADSVSGIINLSWLLTLRLPHTGPRMRVASFGVFGFLQNQIIQSS